MKIYPFFVWASILAIHPSLARGIASQANPEIDCQFQGGKLVLSIGIDRSKRIAYSAETGAPLRSWLAPETNGWYTVVFFDTRLPLSKGALAPGAVPIHITIYRNTLKADLSYTIGENSKKIFTLRGACRKRAEPLI